MKHSDNRTEERQMLSDRPEEVLKLRHTLRWRLTLFVFGVMMVSGILTVSVYLCILILFRHSPLVLALTVNPLFLCVVLLLVSALFGTLLAVFFGKQHLLPTKRLSEATKEIKRGNFKVQVDGDIVPQNSEMGILISNFNEMVRELDSIELFRNDFINNFSHEFKTPIVSIRGFARELQYGDLDDVQRQEYAKIIAEEADRLAKLSINVLELSKLENQQIVINKNEFFLDEQLRQCILLQESEWTKKEIELLLELDEVAFHGNEEILAHIWNNLIGNAIKFTPHGGTVRVFLTADDTSVTVRISDTGIGMSDEVKAHIFDRFYQGDPSHHNRGYGIGLTMAARAATLCGGSITVESELQKGSTFTVTLPRQAQHKT
ncbi:MAG: HAMP domain-containing histidine kinase [Clostridia bacterium]|nr:HAMP domain-containing histidine kinase [Clostridia bacterium]